MTTTANVLPVLPERRRFSVEEYHRLGQTGFLDENSHWELIAGDIIHMTPIGSPHGGRTKKLNALFTQAVGQQAIVAVQDPIVLDNRSEPEPDLALLKPRADFYIDAHPRPDDVLLLVEVADNSYHYDRHTKIPLYAQAAIPEVWIVAIEQRRVLRFAHPEHGAYSHESVLDRRYPAALPGLPGRTIDLSSLF